MPIVKIMFDRALSEQLDPIADELMDKVNEILVEGLASKIAMPQVILQADCHIKGPFLIYVDLQFRASPERSKDKVDAVFKALQALLAEYFSVGVRMRGFAIDQATLSALDAE